MTKNCKQCDGCENIIVWFKIFLSVAIFFGGAIGGAILGNAYLTHGGYFTGWLACVISIILITLVWTGSSE